MLDLFDTKSLFCFLLDIVLACDMFAIFKGAALCLLRLFINVLAVLVLKFCIAHWSKPHKHQNDGTLTSHCEEATYLLETYAPEDVIIEKYLDMMRLKQPTNKTTTK